MSETSAEALITGSEGLQRQKVLSFEVGAEAASREAPLARVSQFATICDLSCSAQLRGDFQADVCSF